MTAAFVLNFKNPKCRVGAAKYDDARAPPRPKIGAKCRNMLLHSCFNSCRCMRRSASHTVVEGREMRRDKSVHTCRKCIIGRVQPPTKTICCRATLASSNCKSLSIMSQQCHYAPHSLKCELQVRVMRDSCVSNSDRHRLHAHSCAHRALNSGAEFEPWLFKYNLAVYHVWAVELENRNVEHNDEETTPGTSKKPNSMGIRIV